jgi:hypothetical protein
VLEQLLPPQVHHKTRANKHMSHVRPFQAGISQLLHGYIGRRRGWRPEVDSTRKSIKLWSGDTIAITLPSLYAMADGEPLSRREAEEVVGVGSQ